MLPRLLKKQWTVVAALLSTLVSCVVCLINPIVTAVSPLMAVSNAASKTCSRPGEQVCRLRRSSCSRILAASTQYGKIHTTYNYSDDAGASGSGDVTLLCNGVGRDFAATAALDSNQRSTSCQVFLDQARLAFKTSGTGDSFYGITFDTYDSDIKAFAPVSGLDAGTVGAVTDVVAFLESAMKSNNVAVYEDYSRIIENFVMNLTPV